MTDILKKKFLFKRAGRHFGFFKRAGRHEKGAGRRALQKKPRQNTGTPRTSRIVWQYFTYYQYLTIPSSTTCIPGIVSHPSSSTSSLMFLRSASITQLNLVLVFLAWTHSTHSEAHWILFFPDRTSNQAILFTSPDTTYTIHIPLTM